MSNKSQALVGRVGKIATSTLANALDDFGLADQILPTIKAVATGMRAAGPAVTIRESVGELGAYSSEDFKVGAIIDAADFGDFLIISGGGARVSTWGGMASFAAKKKGIVGLIADIGVRDLEEMIEFNFPVFARHLTPLTGRTRLKVEEINEPVEVDGVIIEPGDLVVADSTGVVVLPSACAEKIIINAEHYNADDSLAIKDLDNGLTFSEVMRKYTRI
ncbi:MAG: aspartate aminotransferase [Magnetovibrio sp.]|nr:aspartate aminotransferase [Magnetovibrio sp.]